MAKTQVKPKEVAETVASSMAMVPLSDLQKMVAGTQQAAAILGKFIKDNLKEGVDFGRIKYVKKTTGQEVATKPFLFKPGAEKFCILFNIRPVFTWLKEDYDKGFFSVKCELMSRASKEILGEGYGAARVGEKPTWNENEAMKMACKRSQVDSALRTFGLSEHFTQDEDSVVRTETRTTQPTQRATLSGKPTMKNPNAPISEKQRNMVFALMNEKGIEKEKLESYIEKHLRKNSIADLTMGEAGKVIDMLMKLENKPSAKKTKAEPEQVIDADTGENLQ